MNLLCLSLPKETLRQLADQSDTTSVTLMDRVYPTGAAESQSAAGVIVHIGQAADVNRLSELRSNGVLRPLFAWVPEQHLQHRIRSLQAGADGCFDNTWPLADIIAQVTALFRRPWGWGTDHVISVDGLEMDSRRRTCFYHGQMISLAPVDFQYLARMAFSPHRVLHKSGPGPEADPSGTLLSMESSIRRLRLKLNDPKGRFIRTLRGVGYKLGN